MATRLLIRGRRRARQRRMPLGTAPVLLSAVMSFAVFAGQEEAVHIDVGATRLVGELTDGGRSEVYRGIPFAKPPVGDLRWLPPQPLPLPAGELQARNFRPACAQEQHIIDWYRSLVADFGGDSDSFPVPEISEDCLYLNLWRPRSTAPEERLPLLIYVHGGSNKAGWSYEPNYLGARLAEKGLVVASVAYRLGPLGFFSHPELDEANFALLDLLAAVRWLREQAPALGIDTQRITLMGESAGASNISQLLAMPDARGLFQRVIHQSAGWAVWQGGLDREQELSTYERIGDAWPGRDGGLAELRKVPASQLLAAVSAVLPAKAYDAVVDGASMPADLPQQLRDGAVPAIDLLIGTNADEWLIYLAEDDSLQSWRAEQADKAIADAMLKALPEGLTESVKLDRLTTAETFVCPSLDFAEYVRRKGGRSWAYYFSRVREGERGAAMGAYHGAELPYVFDTHDDWLPTHSVDRELTDTLLGYWSNFAMHGDPNGDGLPPWPAYAAEYGSVQVLDEQVRTAPHPSAPLCNVMRSRPTQR